MISQQSRSVFHCPTCGRRFRGAACPHHGTPAAFDTNDALAAELPDFPGLRVSGVLGRGGFGVVYAAEDERGRPVAVKAAHRERPFAEARLRREAEALRTVGPPHVPELLGEGALSDGTCYVVMELLDAPTLSFVLADRGPLAVDEALRIAGGLAHALAAAHARGLVHRDLKPDNVFVDEQHVRLVDFGLVKATGAADGAHLTAAGTVLGSPSYMSPEQASAQAEIDERSDVYSFGVMLFEMLAGRTPFLGNGSEVLMAHVARRPPRLARLVAVPEGVESLVQRCLAKRREDRPASGAALGREL